MIRRVEPANAVFIGTAGNRLVADVFGDEGPPVLVAVGTKDDVAGAAAPLAALLPRGRALDIPGRDHMLAVGDKVFKAGVLAFLEEQ